MFGNILIDKLRFSVKRDEINPYEAQYKLNAIMSEHFRKDNYTANFDKRYFRLTFTPTLYLDSVEAMEGLPILNLEMISEQKLLQLLKQVYSVLGYKAVGTWIDLNKGIITEEPVFKYIKALGNRQFRYPYKKNESTSKTAVTSLILSSVKRDDSEVDSRNTAQQITLYDDVEEITSKSDTRFIDDVYLSDEEIAQIPECLYEREIGRLWLNQGVNKLHLLRLEQRYKYTKYIKKITHHLTGSNDVDELTLPILIELLEKGELYKKLDEFYTNHLRKHVFFDDIEQLKDITLNKHELMIVDELQEYDDIDINTFAHFFKEIDLTSQYKYSTKKILYHTIGKYYKELYAKLGIQSLDAAPELTSKESLLIHG